jgi:hypothetical protein
VAHQTLDLSDHVPLGSLLPKNQTGQCYGNDEQRRKRKKRVKGQSRSQPRSIVLPPLDKNALQERSNHSRLRAFRAANLSLEIFVFIL